MDVQFAEILVEGSCSAVQQVCDPEGLDQHLRKQAISAAEEVCEVGVGGYTLAEGEEDSEEEAAHTVAGAVRARNAGGRVQPKNRHNPGYLIRDPH